MNNAALRAKQLLDSLGYSEPADLTMEEIAYAAGFMVQYQKMDGSEGRIMMNDKDVLITVNSTVDFQPKINYILSHEIGHGILHRQILPVFNDTQKTLSEWYAKGTHEIEANQFAEELLMPSDLFKRKVKGRKLDISLIQGAADYFGASKTATFLRYKELGDFPVMIVFIENGLVKWKSCSSDFPFKFLTLGSKVPAFTVAGDYYYRQVEEKKPAKVKAIEWFPEDYACQRETDTAKVWEQCFPGNTSSIVTCIWTA